MSTLLFALIAVAICWFAWKKGFFRWSPSPPLPVTLKNCLSIFGIFIGGSYVLIPLILAQMGPSVPLQFFLLLGLLFALLFYGKKRESEAFSKIWKKEGCFHDFGFGVLALFVAIPIVAVVGDILDAILYYVYQVEGYEQVAVRYLKETLQSPLMMSFALLTILVLAPMIEEFLFRGTLQNYLKNKLGAKSALLLTSLTFALFHYSPQQGLGNLSLLPCLFLLGCFLGFVYERQGSLFASIGLHFSFNLFNCLRIVLAPEAS